ncbi:MAG: hypothetical protein M3Q65_25885 [Chloroflexota bacterium]|nr:hypothetical protein [Chloroflexota bacterium]
MGTEDRLARLRDAIAGLERHSERHPDELERLYALLAVYQQATTPAPTAIAAPPTPAVLIPAAGWTAPVAA